MRWRGRSLFLFRSCFVVLLLHFCFVDSQITNLTFLGFDQPGELKVHQDVVYNSSSQSFFLNVRGNNTTQGFPSCGRIYYKDKVQMMNNAIVARFSTSFTFSITGEDVNYYPEQSYLWMHADGFAFMIMADANADGGSTLCLLQRVNNKLTTNIVFAVKFDTFQSESVTKTGWKYKCRMVIICCLQKVPEAKGSSLPMS